MAHSSVVRNLGKVSMALWGKLPPPLLETRTVRTLGHAIHKTVCRYAPRSSGGSTWFMRNPPLLAGIAEQIHNLRPSGFVRICDIGCSIGSEVYSVLWMLRRRFPQIPVSMLAMDLSAEAIERAQAGRYKADSLVFRGRMDQATRDDIFYREGYEFVVKPWLREGIQWLVADATDPEIAERFGKQDAVLANNFLVHMNDDVAMNCMVNLTRLVRPRGLFVCRGVDLDVREKMAERLWLRPVTSYIEEIHNADGEFDARCGWPWRYWGLEPIDKSRANWTQRYAAMFLAPPA